MGIVLGLGTMAYIARLTRTHMLEIKRQDYVRTARAKGLAATKVVNTHMLRNVLIPSLTASRFISIADAPLRISSLSASCITITS